MKLFSMMLASLVSVSCARNEIKIELDGVYLAERAAAKHVNTLVALSDSISAGHLIIRIKSVEDMFLLVDRYPISIFDVKIHDCENPEITFGNYDLASGGNGYIPMPRAKTSFSEGFYIFDIVLNGYYRAKGGDVRVVSDWVRLPEVGIAQLCLSASARGYYYAPYKYKTNTLRIDVPKRVGKWKQEKQEIDRP